jgi:thiamine-phosphate pyrophosphorylase
MIVLPRLYAILDAAFCSDLNTLLRNAEDLAGAGVTLLQYRNKTQSARQVLETAQALRRLLPSPFKLIMNDRVDLCLAAEFDGVHLGQDDLSPAAARRILGPERWLGVSTHNPAQLAEADRTPADYLAIGPVYGTQSKANPDPVVGLEGVRAARALTRKPLVAIGGITRANARQVLEAGADTLAVISDLCRDPAGAAREFFSLLR